MKFLKKHWKFFALMAFIILVATGCVSYDDAGNPTGAVYEYIGVPTAHFMDFIANIFNGSYGMSIIIITFITRLIMMPSTYRMTKNSMISSAKMKFAQPEIKAVQEEIEATEDPKEKAALNQELMQVYSKYDINMFSSLSGCLPLIIQLPIISAVYAAIRSSEQIANSSFLGIDLAERSIIIVVLVVITAFLQGWLMQKVSPTVDTGNQQAGSMQNSMLIMNPLMLGWFTFVSNAGLGLYFLTGSIFGLIQQAYMNYVARPKIQKQVDDQAEKYASIPREQRKSKARKSKAAIKEENSQRIVPVKTTTRSSNTGGRNAGKQNRNGR